MTDINKYLHAIPSAEEEQKKNNDYKEKQIDADIMKVIKGLDTQDFDRQPEDVMNGIVYKCDMPRFASASTLYSIFSAKGYYVYIEKNKYGFKRLLIGTEPLFSDYAHVTIDQVIRIIESIYVKKKSRG